MCETDETARRAGCQAPDRSKAQPVGGLCSTGLNGWCTASPLRCTVMTSPRRAEAAPGESGGRGLTIARGSDTRAALDALTAQAPQSERRATPGSTREARSAGSSALPTATSTRTRTTPASTVGSEALTPKSSRRKTSASTTEPAPPPPPRPAPGAGSGGAPAARCPAGRPPRPSARRTRGCARRRRTRPPRRCPPRRARGRTRRRRRAGTPGSGGGTSRVPGPAPHRASARVPPPASGTADGPADVRPTPARYDRNETDRVPGVLGVRVVQDRRRRLVERAEGLVRHDADDGERRVRVRRVDALAHRVLAREEPPLQAPVHDDHLLRAPGVLRGERAAAEDRDPEHPEVGRLDRADRGVGLGPGGARAVGANEACRRFQCRAGR